MRNIDKKVLDNLSAEERENKLKSFAILPFILIVLCLLAGVLYSGKLSANIILLILYFVEFLFSLLLTLLIRTYFKKHGSNRRLTVIKIISIVYFVISIAYIIVMTVLLFISNDEISVLAIIAMYIAQLVMAYLNFNIISIANEIKYLKSNH